MTLLIVAVVLAVLAFGWILLRAGANREAAWKEMADREAIG